MFWTRNDWNPACENPLRGLFSGATGAVHEFPAVNVWQNDERALVTAELPGLAPEGIDISVLGDALTLQGRRQLEEATGDATFHRRERPSGEFTRTVELPFPVDADKIDATFHSGVLSIVLPRAAADKPRKVAIKAA